MKIYDQVQSTSRRKVLELDVVSNFFCEFGAIERKYKDELVGLCIKFQKQVYEAFSDEKMQQFFQMLFNNLLQRSDQITRAQKSFEDITSKIGAMNKDFQKSIRGRIDLLDQGLVSYAELLKDNRVKYLEYIKECNALNDKSHKKLDDLQDQLDLVFDLQEVVDQVRDRPDKVRLLDRIANFKVDVGKRKAQKMKDKFREQRSKNNWTEKDDFMFSERWDELRGEVMRQTKMRMIQLKNQEKAIIANTEKRIGEFSKREEGFHVQLSDQMFEYLRHMESSLSDCVRTELSWKNQTKSLLVQFMYSYFPDKKDMILKKAERTEKSIEEFISKFSLISKVD